MTTWTVTSEKLGNRTNVVGNLHGGSQGHLVDPNAPQQRFMSEIMHPTQTRRPYLLHSGFTEYTANRLKEYRDAYDNGFDIIMVVKEPTDRSVANAVAVVQNHYDQIVGTYGYPPPWGFMYGNEMENPVKGLTNLPQKVAQTGKWVRDNYPDTFITIGAFNAVSSMLDLMQSWWTECTVTEGWTPDAITFHEYNAWPSVPEQLGTRDLVRTTLGAPDLEIWNSEGDRTFIDLGPGDTLPELEDRRGASFILHALCSYLRTNTPYFNFYIQDEPTKGGNGLFYENMEPRIAYQAYQMMAKLASKPVFNCSPDVWDETECAASFDGDYGYVLASRMTIEYDKQGGPVSKWMDIKDGLSDPDLYYTSVGGRAPVLAYIAGLGPDPGNPSAIPYVPDYEGAKTLYNFLAAEDAQETKLMRIRLPIGITDVKVESTIGPGVSWVHFRSQPDHLYFALRKDEAVLLSFRKKRTI